MQKWYKVALLLSGLLMFTGCSVKKKALISSKNTVSSFNIEQFCIDVRKSNLSSGGFVIKKGKAKTKGLKVNGTYSFNGKFAANGDFMISLRGPLSIEVFRLFSVKDDVFMINRLQRVIYTGSKMDFLNSYDIPKDFIGLLFGDFPGGTTVDKSSLYGSDDVSVECNEDPYKEEMTFSRTEMKLKRVLLRTEDEENTYILEYRDFRSLGIKKYPFEVKILQEKKDIEIDLYLEEVLPEFTEEIVVSLPDYRKIAL